MELSKSKKLLVFTGWYPTPGNQHQYTFVSQQVKIMQHWLPQLSGQDWTIIVWHETTPVDLPNRYLRRVSPKNFEWKDGEVLVKHRQSTILSHRLWFDQSLFLVGNMKVTYKKIVDLLGGAPDCVWTVTLSSAILWNYFESSQQLRIPFFLQEHSNPLSMHLKKKHKVKAARSLVKRVSEVVVVADRQIREFSDLCKDYDCRVVWNAVDPVFLDTFLGMPVKKSMIYVGRLSGEKGLYRLIEAVKLVVRKLPKFKLSIIGSGQLEEELRLTVKRLNLETVVKFYGSKTSTQISSMLEEHEVFVLPSYYENCPVSLLEAQVKGLPCLVTKNGASEKVLLNGNGIVVEDDGSGKQLADGILEIFEDISSYDRDDIKRRSVKEFSPGVFALRMYNLIKELS